MLGNYLKTYFSKKYEIKCFTRNEIDLTSDEKNIKDFLFENIKNDDIIINAAGIIKQRKYNELELIKVNTIFPHLLTNLNCKVIHITTDCVFSGAKGFYTESDLHDCTDDYGKSKSLGENKELTIIRTSIIGEEINNKKSLLEWVKSQTNKTIDGYTNHIWNGVTCLELCKIIDNIIVNNNFWKGVRHIFSPNYVSKYNLISMINDIYNLNLTINKKETENNCIRTLSSNYDCFWVNDLIEQLKEIKIFKL
jgi:dTDP-4-dehydrorhamnose reductase